MTGQEAQKYIGQVFKYHVPNSGLEVAVRVEDWKRAYSYDMFLCVPVAGQGSTWLRAESLRGQ